MLYHYYLLVSVSPYQEPLKVDMTSYLLLFPQCQASLGPKEEEQLLLGE